MKLYDDIIYDWQQSFLKPKAVCEEQPEDGAKWPEASECKMVLRSDMAYELGGSNLPAIGCTVITMDQKLIPKDAVYRIGPDLNALHRDTPYARISIVSVNADKIGEGDVLYNAIRKMEYTRYHFYPEGFMMRVSAMDHREGARISKKAVSEGITFAKIGAGFNEAFRRQQTACHVETYFITDPSFDYKKLKMQMQDAENITKTIDHIFKELKMDCNACNLQKICEKVEGLKELHFAKSQSTTQ